MPTFTKIETITVGSGGAASVTFSSIPQTFTDLVMKISSRQMPIAMELCFRLLLTATLLIIQEKIFTQMEVALVI